MTRPSPYEARRISPVLATPRRPFAKWAAWSVCLLFCLFLGDLAHAQDGAELAPHDAGVLIQVNDLAKLRAAWNHDPLLRKLVDQVESARGDEGWALVQAAMGMDAGQILDTYFGRKVVVIAQEEGEGKPGFILSQVTPADMVLAIERLSLVPRGQAGKFRLYTTTDDKGQFAFSDAWMALCDIAHLDYMTQTLARSAGEPSLVEDPQYQALIGHLPDDPQVLVFVRQPREQAVHALAMQVREQRLVLSYAGHPGDGEGRHLLKLNPRTSGFSAGPLAASTMAALFLQVFSPDMPVQNERMLDRLIAPRTLRHDILPKLAGPVLLALAEDPPLSATTQPQRPQPVLALAIELKDPSVAADFQRLLDGAALLLNLQAAQQGEDPLLQSDHSHGGAAYRVVDLGPILARREDRPELENLQLVYGRAGSWFLLTTSRTYFEACLDAAVDPALRGRFFQTTADPAAGNLPAPALGIFSMQTQLLASHLQRWIDFWEKTRPQLLEAAERQPQSPEGRFVQAAILARELLSQLKGLEMQIHQLDDITLGATLILSR